LFLLQPMKIDTYLFAFTRKGNESDFVASARSGDSARATDDGGMHQANGKETRARISLKDMSADLVGAPLLTDPRLNA